MNKVDIDKLLENLLDSSETPSHELNRKTKNMMKERIQMNKKTKFSLRFALIAAVVLVVSSIAVYAAVKYLTVGEAAGKFGYPKLVKAFESEGSLLINETVSSGGYNVTLLGIAFGKDLTGFTDDTENGKTYAIIAIEKPDEKMPDTSSDDYGKIDFFVSPLIRGYKPWQVNIFTMGGGSNSFVVDGIMYRLVECDSVEMFADIGVYIGVSNNNDVFCNNESFIFDAETGEIRPNSENGCTSVVFELSIDKSKADPEKAEKFLRSQQLIDDARQPDDADSINSAKDLLVETAGDSGNAFIIRNP